MIFQNFLSTLYSVSCVSHESVPLRRDRCGMVPAESAAETATLNHDRSTHRHMDDDDDITCRIKVKALTFNGVYDLWVFSD